MSPCLFFFLTLVTHVLLLDCGVRRGMPCHFFWHPKSFERTRGTHIPTWKASSLGYKHCVVVSLAFTAHSLDILASDVLAGEHLRVIVARFCYWISLGLVGWPFLCKIINSIVRRFLLRTGWAEILYLILAILCALTLAATWELFHQSLARLAVSSLWRVGLYVAGNCLEFVVIHGFQGR